MTAILYGYMCIYAGKRKLKYITIFLSTKSLSLPLFSPSLPLSPLFLSLHVSATHTHLHTPFPFISLGFSSILPPQPMHFFPMAMYTHKLIPPPDKFSTSLGETRSGTVLYCAALNCTELCCIIDALHRSTNTICGYYIIVQTYLRINS